MTLAKTADLLRKTHVGVEEIWHERGPRAQTPLRVGVALAVVRNPFAGRHEADLMQFQADLRELGTMLSTRLVDALGGAANIEAYGKGAIVGEIRDSLWPWPREHWNVQHNRRNLVRAAALIVADIERLDRKTPRVHR